MSKLSQIYLGGFFLLTSIISFFNILYCYYFEIFYSLNGFIYLSIVSLILSFALFIQDKKNMKIVIYEKILIVILGYIFIPLIFVIPYYFGSYDIAFIDCYFESISGFTSTGFTIFDNIKHIDESLIIWRSSTQWIGGIYFLFSIIILIDIFDNNLKKSLTNFLSFNTNEIIKQSFKVLILYSLITILIFFILKFINLRSFDSLNLSLSLISSGGFLPFKNIEAIINTDFKRFVFSILMLLSFFSIFLTYNIVYFKKKGTRVFLEDLNLFIYLIVIVFIFLIFYRFDNNFSYIFFSITSSISNIGFSFKEVPLNLIFIFFVLTIIGGSFFSTSSGLRFIKIYSLVKFSINELLSHSKPNHIFKNKIPFTDSFILMSDIEKYFLSILIFILSLFTISFLLTLGGFNFDESFKIGILTIMNTVNSSMYNLDEFSFSNITNYSKIILIIFMIIGRVEFITILILLKKFLLKS